MSTESTTSAQEEARQFGLVRAIAAEPVAVGLALLLFVRPWRDGITFPGWDAYFIWGTLALGALWGARMLLRGEPVRFRTPILLLGAYLVVALATAPATIQFDATYRSLLNWWGYFLAFGLAANALRTRLSVGIVLTGLVASALPNAIWAIIHLKYTLAYMREVVANDPSILAAYGMAGEISPELRHRIESNRAFGTLLYPNALAAWLLLVIPVAVGFLVPSWREWQESMKGAAPDMPKQARLYQSAAVGVSTWFFATASAFFLYPFLLLVMTQDGNWGAHAVSMVFYLLVLPLLIGGFSLWITRRKGLRAFRLTLQVLGLAGLAAVGPVSLVLTWSRGGFLAIIAAVVATGILFVAGGRGFRFPVRATAAAAVLLCCFAVVTLEPEALAQEAAPEGDINVAGRAQDVGALSDPSTLLLRLTYWKVGWRMFLEAPLTGVGLGNFGTAYATYQEVGDGATQTAHNAYVKALAETGIAGFITFCAFWLFFIAWGAMRLLDATSAAQRWQLAGLYCAVLAYLLHSMLDFNFANSALTFPAMVLAGLFFAVAGREQPVPATSKISQVAAIPFLLVIALALGASLRVFFYDLAIVEGGLLKKLIHVGEMNEVRTRAASADFFLRDLPVQPQKEGQPAIKRLTEVAPLFPNAERIRAFGEIRDPVRGSPGNFRLVQPDEAPSEQAVVVIRDRLAARAQAVEMSLIWIEAMELRDELYPHTPETAAILFEWHDHLQKQERNTDVRRGYIEKMRRWAEEGVRRSPRQSWFHTYRGKSLLIEGAIRRGQESVDLYREAIAAYRRGTELYPVSDVAWAQYGEAMVKVGDAFVKAGMTEEGERLVRDGRAAKSKAQALTNALRAAGA